MSRNIKLRSGFRALRPLWDNLMALSIFVLCIKLHPIEVHKSGCIINVNNIPYIIAQLASVTDDQFHLVAGTVVFKHGHVHGICPFYMVILIPYGFSILILIIGPYDTVIRAEAIIVSIRILQVFHKKRDTYVLKFFLCNADKHDRRLPLLQRKERSKGVFLYRAPGLSLFCVFCGYFVSRIFGRGLSC